MTQPWTAPQWTAPRELDRIRTFSIGAAVVGIIVCIIGLVVDPKMFFPSYLVAFMFWLGLSLGSIAFLSLYHLVGGDWGRSIRRPLESASLNVILMAVLFIPILFGMSRLYPWMHWTDADRAIAPHKAIFFARGFFYVRTAIYFAVWIVIALLLNIFSTREDQSAAPMRIIRMVAGPAIPIYGITITAASFDWVMSLQPFWFSSMWGLIYITGQGLTCLAFMVILMSMFREIPPLSRVLSRGVFNDMGNLLLTFTMLYAYTSFSQFLIIWSGNIKDEVAFYMNRTQGFWGAIIILMVIFHFALPFGLLLSRDIKSNPTLLCKLSILILVARIVELCWQIEPASDYVIANSAMEWIWRVVLNLAAPLAVGGIWMTLFITRFKSRPLLARHPVDPETTVSALNPEGGLAGHGGAYDAGPNLGGHHA
jgi:hypothetical protein